jgi:hypothetical protein
MNIAILALALAAGVISALVSQLSTGWWLDSGRGVTLMMAMLCALSIALVWVDRRAPLALWVGMMNATIVILFVTGPGSIFPIVIAFAAGLSALAIVPGWLLWIIATGSQSAVRALLKRHLG